jgi:ferrous iron transport protein B
MVIWAMGYFPVNSNIINHYNSRIILEENKYDQLLQQHKSGSAEHRRLTNLKEKNISQLRYQKNNELQENSLIGIIGKSIEPIMRPLGFDWKMSVSLLAGVAAKEVVVSTMGVLYQVEGDPDSDTQPLQTKLQKAAYESGPRTGQSIFTPVTAFAYLMFILLYFPCVAVVAAVKKESGNWKWALFMVAYTTSIAWIVALLVNQVGNLIV